MYELSESEKISGVRVSDLSGISFGYIVLPRNVERDKYVVESCLNNKAHVYDNILKTYIGEVMVTDQLLNDIEFPKKPKDFGSAVIIGYLNRASIPVCLGTINNKKSYNNTKQNSFRFTKSFNGNMIEIFGDSESGTLSISTSGGKNATILNIDVSGKNDSSLNINVLGKTKIKTSKQTDIEDSFGNSVSLTNKGVVLTRSTKNNGKIFLGGNNVDKKSVLGDELKTIIEELIDAITQITVTTPTGPSVLPLLNAASFSLIKQKLDTMLTENVLLK